VRGWEGWRFAILLLGIASCVVGVLNFGLARDPRCPGNRMRQEASSQRAAAAKRGAQPGLGKEIGSVLIIPTFVIIILQVGHLVPPVPMGTSPCGGTLNKLGRPSCWC
jgi:hypothetical protein